MAADGVLETIARGLARGMSRREALRTGGVAVVADLSRYLRPRLVLTVP